MDIAASPATVWGIVSDLRRTPEWSPECRRVVVLRRAGSIQPGTQLLGINRLRFAVWPTRSVVTEVSPEQRIAWNVRTSGATWSYELEPTPTGTRLVERRDGGTGMPTVAATFTRFLLGGVSGHSAELEDHIEVSLLRIKSLAEKE
ncbi:polyketide cyclase [Knoellia sinensis KCTC 19936]|uniref:Polyketide cyclase n=1 Tax=Knoellia sinensis KCTC 19936 TaxID=1385520 RepID=A0A0A0J8H7_9MICO|nr:polyketide cyclase [Knoellia sinensis KCTC 19936]